MGSPAYKACPTFVSSLQATCQLSRSCTTLLSSGGFSAWFALSMPSCLFSVRFFHSLPLFLLLTLSFTGFPIADEIILISKHQKISRHSFSILSTSPADHTPGSPLVLLRLEAPSPCNRPPISTSTLSLPVPPRPSFQDGTTATPPRHSHDQTRIQPAS